MAQGAWVVKFTEDTRQRISSLSAAEQALVQRFVAGVEQDGKYKKRIIGPYHEGISPDCWKPRHNKTRDAMTYEKAPPANKDTTIRCVLQETEGNTLLMIAIGTKLQGYNSIHTKIEELRQDWATDHPDYVGHTKAIYNFDESPSGDATRASVGASWGRAKTSVQLRSFNFNFPIWNWCSKEDEAKRVIIYSALQLANQR
eukprot:TRINITY_DN1827_c0_g2_i4.p1 TRINITY_DN1827_c0_g2~~TRINITY_DN1827_c0_g2_i4.p1  ORF type:complete len:200 (+),score=35.10 TRINITY_DN1827_c0_g2_i4:2-601(+)